jgi:hypothetical protein
MKKSLTGQYKFNLDTGQICVVGSKATEHPNLEKQASLLDWAEARQSWSGGKVTSRVGADVC